MANLYRTKYIDKKQRYFLTENLRIQSYWPEACLSSTVQLVFAGKQVEKNHINIYR